MAQTYDSKRALEVLAECGEKIDPYQFMNERDLAAKQVLSEVVALNERAGVIVESKLGQPRFITIHIGERSVGLKYSDGSFIVLGPWQGMQTKVPVCYNRVQQRFEGEELSAPEQGRRDALVEIAMTVVRQFSANPPGTVPAG